ncbi:glutamate--tRNA ligase [Spirosoma utsteinense]|uniref:Glutamate--tRNA ligase n=1 Tax=Spirosoma utsteinense TaxID=2585773 RepID=A0ABR6W5Z2_9BACT|nr:glutamate--tRNA ligase [Spirosoma utsteinense]MBC3785329.1 glutamyl-tRNA synthetase [Spirosoma utsteinense]MBC3791644.1 glutamyl-tRNA synthetase [Spirosoma utsteinense]
MSKPVRVRFAPSPTGPLHIGGVRTALYNYLFARKMGGKMLLRIEDTDQNRFVPGAEEYIVEALHWAGIVIDEGQGVGGPHAPYRQSERRAIYQKEAQRLVDEGKAYYAFDTAEELDAMRQRLEAANAPAAQYNSITRMQMRNSLTLKADEVKARIDAGDPYVIRLKTPRKEEVRLNDLIRGWVNVHSSAIDDKVLLKSDGLPTYHLANIVDDHLMEITHVIRGEEWLPSAPLHVLLYRYLGWEDTMPQFAHLPLLLKPEGNGKLSKRDADLGGFPIFPLQWTDPVTGVVAKGFREEGYLPEATINFLALLGWNPGTEQELFTMDELIASFDLTQVHKAGARFDIQKAQWFNHQYIRLRPDAELAPTVQQQAEAAGFDCPPEKAEKIVSLLKGRINFAHEIFTEAATIFNAPTTYDEAIAAAKWNDDAVRAVTAFRDALQAYDGPFMADDIKHTLGDAMTQAGIKQGKIMQAMRLALTGTGAGPDLMLTMEIIGKDETVGRLETALNTLKTAVK